MRQKLGLRVYVRHKYLLVVGNRKLKRKATRKLDGR